LGVDIGRTYKDVVEFDVTMNEAERVQVTNSFSDIDRDLQPDNHNTTAANVTHRHESQGNIITTL